MPNGVAGLSRGVEVILARPSAQCANGAEDPLLKLSGGGFVGLSHAIGAVKSITLRQSRGTRLR